MDLLWYLAQNAGTVVSREKLLEAVWPGVIVGDDTLTQAVIKLRRALGDRAKAPRYLQTIPKRGYRLSAPVDLDPDSTEPVRARSRHQGLYLVLGVAALLAGLLIALLMLDLSSRQGDKAISTTKVPDGQLPTLTVEPFTQLGEDESQGYLAQGLTFDLITDLSKLSGLWIVGSRSVMGQKSDEASPARARYRVSGDVQQAGDQLRVHVHLVDTESLRQIWSERYQRSFDNLFQIQEDISRHIASALSVEIRDAEQRRLAHHYTQNVMAYKHFLRAQSLLLTRLKEENDKARRSYRQAIALDPSFARAYAGLALSFTADYRNQWATDGPDALQRARRMARTALQIDPDIPEVYWVLAYVSAQQREHEKAIRLLRKSISLDQSFADAYALMGGINTYLGRSRETPDLMRTAIRLNPNAGYLYFLLLGRAYFFLEDWEQSLINLNEAVTRNPANLEAHIYLAAVMASSDDHDGSAWEAMEIRSLQPDFDTGSWLQTYPMTDQAQTRQLVSALAGLGLNGRE